MLEAKAKITLIVQEYKKNFSVEYSNVVSIVKEKRRNNANRFAKINEGDILERQLFEISETLDGLFFVGLSIDEGKWFRTQEGSRWFTKTFREFASAEKI